MFEKYPNSVSRYAYIHVSKDSPPKAYLTMYIHPPWVAQVLRNSLAMLISAVPIAAAILAVKRAS